MRVLGFAVVAALTMAAFLASSALALPEWGECSITSTHEGRYSDSVCTKKAKKISEKFTGEYEWHNSTTFGQSEDPSTRKSEEEYKMPLIAIQHFEPMTLESALVKCEPSEEPLVKCREGEAEERTPINVECEKVNSSAGLWSKSSAKVIDKFSESFKGCHALGLVCGNAEVGMILTNPLKGTVGYIKKATPKEVGIDWKPEFGKEVSKFTCGETMTIVVGGASAKEGPFYPPKGGASAVIAKITPINTMGEEASEEFNLNTETDANTPTSFEGKPFQGLEDYSINTALPGKGSKWSPAGIALTQAASLCGFCSHGNDGEKRTEAELKA